TYQPIIMRSYFLTLAALLTIVATSVAQNYDPVKTLVMLNQFDKAKTDIDKAFGNAKYTAKPEAFILKACVYVKNAEKSLSEKKDTAIASQLNEEADKAFLRFVALDSSLKLTNDQPYSDVAIALYNNYYYLSIYEYNRKDYKESLSRVNKAIFYSDLLIKKNIIKSTIDTNLLEIAAVIAETGSFKDDAAYFYRKLADAEVVGDRYVGVYKYLISHSFATRNMIDFEKFRKIGKSLYPTNDYFDYDRVDFAVGLANSFDEKLKAIEELLATDPDNFKANELLGEILYDTLDAREEGAVLPANYAELEMKMIAAFNRVAKAKSGYEIPYLYIGDHFINKAAVVSEKRDQHARDMKARTKPGTMASKEDIAKRDALDKEYGETLEGAKEPYENAAGIFAAKAELDTRDKIQYKKAAGYLADIYAFKKAMAAKAKNTTEQNKWAMEEKKWNDRYESIKN
ncbi:MAG: hypothetical protein ACKO41_06580, partial [Sphingomonadales bacterium]